MTTWDEAFADRYDEWSAAMTADVEFFVSLAMEAPDGAIVELAAGDGRVAIPVAQATGRRVVGIDLSPTMVERGRARAKEADVDLDLRLGDMRDFVLDEPAALVYCPYRALLHVPTWADRRRTFEHVASALIPSGRFAWNAWALDHQIAVKTDGLTIPTPVPHTIASTSATIAWKSRSTMDRRAFSGGLPRTNGWVSWTYPGSNSKPCTARSTVSPCLTRVASMCSSRDAL